MRGTMIRNRKFDELFCVLIKLILLALLAFEIEALVRGKEAEPRTFKYVAQLIDTQNGHDIPGCHGVLLAEADKKESDLVLTAAHCVCRAGSGPETFRTLRVLLGERAGPSRTESQIAKVYCHRGYRRTLMTPDDIALIRLRAPVKFNDFIHGSTWKDAREVAESNVKCRTATYGAISLGEDPTGTKDVFPTKLHYMMGRTVGRQDCPNYIVGKSICFLGDAQPDGHRSIPVRGDSGSGLVCEINNTWVLVGINKISLGRQYVLKPRGTWNYISTWSSLHAYQDWIANEAIPGVRLP